MGRKVHPIGFRLGTFKDWRAKWHAEKHFVEYLQEDIRLRKAIGDKYADASISLVEIERQANKVAVTIHTARPGIVIGRGGQLPAPDQVEPLRGGSAHPAALRAPRLQAGRGPAPATARPRRSRDRRSK